MRGRLLRRQLRRPQGWLNRPQKRLRFCIPLRKKVRGRRRERIALGRGTIGNDSCSSTAHRMPQAAEKGEERMVVELGSFLWQTWTSSTKWRRVTNLRTISEEELAPGRKGRPTDEEENGEVPDLTTRRQRDRHVRTEEEQVRRALH